jgi:hypothetical protein
MIATCFKAAAQSSVNRVVHIKIEQLHRHSCCHTLPTIPAGATPPPPQNQKHNPQAPCPRQCGHRLPPNLSQNTQHTEHHTALAAASTAVHKMRNTSVDTGKLRLCVSLTKTADCRPSSCQLKKVIKGTTEPLQSAHLVLAAGV